MNTDTANPAPATLKSHPTYIYRAVPGGTVTIESLRGNLRSIAASLDELAEAISNHAIDLESMLPEEGGTLPMDGLCNLYEDRGGEISALEGGSHE